MTDDIAIEETKTDKMLLKIQALFAQAEHPNTTEVERDTFLTKANQLMGLYQITHWDLQKVKPKGTEEKPILSESFEISPRLSPVPDELTDLFSTVAEHCGVMGGYRGLGNRDGREVTVKLVGFKDDVDFCQMMYLSLVNQLMQRIDPKPVPTMPLDANIAMQKEAGRTWEQMHHLFIAAGMVEDTPFTKPIGLHYYDLYRKFCSLHDIQAVKANPRNYKRNFALSFAVRIAGRLADIRAQQLANEERGSQGKMELMFREKKLYVEDAFVEFFPHIGRAKASGAGMKFNGQAFNAGIRAADDSDLGAMKVRRGEHMQSSVGALPSGREG